MDEREIDNAGRNVRRLLEDAALLYKCERLPSTLLLLLCAVDALAPRIEGHGRVGERYIQFLTDRLHNYPGPGVKLEKVKIPTTGEMLDFAHIIYTYMRNPIVHEGQTLDVRAGSLIAHVVLDFQDKRLVSSIDAACNRIIVGGDWLIGRLFTILNHELETVVDQ